MELNRLLKKSSNSSLRLSLMNITWFLSETLCFLRDSLILFCTTCSRCLSSSIVVVISFCRLVLKSSWSSELRGTTGWSRWVEWRHLLQTFSWHFKQRRITSSPWTEHLLNPEGWFISWGCTFTGMLASYWTWANTDCSWWYSGSLRSCCLRFVLIRVGMSRAVALALWNSSRSSSADEY